MDKLRIDDIIVVEGKYDKARVLSVADAIVIETDGFAAFSSVELKSMLKKLAESRNIIILTDPDEAGFKIRAYIASMLPSDKVKHALVPDIYGKERRKPEFSKEGKLGVEGMSGEIITQALLKAGVKTSKSVNDELVTPSDLYFLGLSGKEGSADRRRALLSALGLPKRTNVNLLLGYVNATMTKREFIEKATSITA